MPSRAGGTTPPARRSWVVDHPRVTEAQDADGTTRVVGVTGGPHGLGKRCVLRDPELGGQGRPVHCQSFKHLDSYSGPLLDNPGEQTSQHGKSGEN